MKLAVEDVPNRLPVWENLSELFLDTELEADDFQRLGRLLAASRYTLDEIEEILFDEVYPVCIWNLLQVAGVWTAFDSDFLQTAIVKHCRSWFKIPRFLRIGRRVLIGEPWQKLKQAIQEQRSATGELT